MARRPDHVEPGLFRDRSCPRLVFRAKEERRRAGSARAELARLPAGRLAQPPPRELALHGSARRAARLCRFRDGGRRSCRERDAARGRDAPVPARSLAATRRRRAGGARAQDRRSRGGAQRRPDDGWRRALHPARGSDRGAALAFPTLFGSGPVGDALADRGGRRRPGFDRRACGGWRENRRLRERRLDYGARRGREG